MFTRNSIKFKLIFVMSTMIILLMISLVVIQIYNTQILKTKVQNDITDYLKNYSQEIQQRNLESYTKSLDFYIDATTTILAYDLYNIDTHALEEKIKYLVTHPAICSLTVIDKISGSAIAQTTHRQNNQLCKSQLVNISFKNEIIGILEVSYSFDSFNLYFQKNENLINQVKENLLEKLKSDMFTSIVVLIGLTFLITSILIFLISKQITNNVIKPIYGLLDDMKLFSQERFLEEEKISNFHFNSDKNDEISTLSKYFHTHITKLVKKLNKRANYDSLTNLFSRQRFIQDLNRKEDFCIAILDVDRFKEINNYLGMRYGDLVLIEIAKKLKEFFKDTNFRLYRLNGDEFAIFSPVDSIDVENFKQKIENFLNIFEQEELYVDNDTLSLSMSVGISCSNDQNTLVATTTALKLAKKLHKKVVVYQKDLPIVKEYGNNIKMTKIIKKAIKKNLIIPYFQPIEHIKDKKVIKYEALMRMIDKEGNIYTPYDFLSIAKHTGNYGAISIIMIEKAINLFSDNMLTITINLATEDIASGDIYILMEKFKENKNIMNRVVFEITEQEGFDDFEIIKEFINEAKKWGAKIAIDDFGSGYSNFENIIQLNVDFLKIDGSLIKNILTDKSSEIVVETIIEFAKKLNIETIAEFISSEEIYQKVKKMGIDYAQGYYIGKPKTKLLKEKI